MTFQHLLQSEILSEKQYETLSKSGSLDKFEKLFNLLRKEISIVIISGVTGSGKSTLIGMIDSLKYFGTYRITISDGYHPRSLETGIVYDSTDTHLILGTQKRYDDFLQESIKSSIKPRILVEMGQPDFIKSVTII